MSLTGSAELIIIIFGVLFAPFSGENVTGAYFDAINIDTLTIEPLVFNCLDGGMKFEFFRAVQDAQNSWFTITRQSRESLVFTIISHGSEFTINLADYLPGITKDVFRWEYTVGEKSFKLNDDTIITVYRLGNTIYLKSDKSNDVLFSIHK